MTGQSAENYILSPSSHLSSFSNHFFVILAKAGIHGRETSHYHWIGMNGLNLTTPPVG